MLKVKEVMEQKERREADLLKYCTILTMASIDLPNEENKNHLKMLVNYCKENRTKRTCNYRKRSSHEQQRLDSGICGWFSPCFDLRKAR